ncbi:MAG: DUF2189 domain-containing protein [Pseudomonadota bacterium]
MAQDIAAEIAAKFPPVRINSISSDDISTALQKGYQDFLFKRGDLIFIGALYPLIGLLAATFVLGGASLPLLFPLAAGLSLMGPLVSAGFYELARRREAGEDSGWMHFFDVFGSSNFSNIMFVGSILLAVFALWMLTAFIIYSVFMGAMVPQSPGEFLSSIFTTGEGWAMIIIGNLVGLAFAITVLAISFVSLPMLVDKNVGAGRAIRTSVKAFNKNRSVVLRWGITVAVLLAIGAAPLFLGLAVVLPTLGYATWHLYTRTIMREDLPDAERV